MSSPSAIPCREVFDENSQPSAEEISEYAQQLGIDPESESHLLPLARDGLMQALPAPWKAYYDEKLQTHYYYNEETKKTQWDHPLDDVYREIVKKTRDASTHDDTCASVQELLTSEENTKHLERVETKVESDDEDFTIDSENHASEIKDNQPKRPAPLGRPPLAPLSKLDKKLSDLKISPLRRSADGSFKPMLMRNTSDRDILSRQYERPKTLFKQHSEIIDLKMHVLTSPEEENFMPLLGGTKVDKGLPLTGKGSMFLKTSKDLPSPDTEKSLPLDSMTKSDPPKGILREKISDSLQRKAESVVIGKQRQSASMEEDRKSVRFKLETLPDPTISPSSNSSSDQNDNHSIISAPTAPSPVVSSPVRVSSPVLSPVRSSTNVLRPLVLSPLAIRPPLPSVDSPKLSDKESLESDRVSSPRRRLLRPPAGDYIKPDLFQKSFQKIADIVRPGDIETSMVDLEEPVDKDIRPRSPMIPQQKNKISINLMESIDSETSIDSPEKEFANLDLNDLDDSNVLNESKMTNSGEKHEKISPKTDSSSESTSTSETSNSTQNKSPRLTDIIPVPQIKVPKLDLSPKVIVSDTEDSKKIEEPKKVIKPDSIDIKSPQAKVSPLISDGSDTKSSRYDFYKPRSSPLSPFKPMNKAVIAPLKASESSTSLGKGLTSPRLDGVILSQGKSSSDNVVVVYQFETQEDSIAKPRSPIPDVGREMIERSKVDERKRLELALQKELEGIRVEIATKERRMRAELQDDLKETEDKFLVEKRVRLTEQAERHRREMEEAISSAERSHQEAMVTLTKEMEERHRRETEAAEKQHNENMARLREECQRKLAESREHLEIENERALSELREQLQANFNRQRVHLVEQNKAAIEVINEQHREKVADLTQDYRAEVERLRTQHACHLEELRARLASSRVASRLDERALADKYKCLKEKYARLKHDVKMSIERRNKRREMSMTTGSETEKSNSHKANQSLEKCKEVNETSVSATIDPEPEPEPLRGRVHTNNNCATRARCNDNETSVSDSNALKSPDNNNEQWTRRKEKSAPSPNTNQSSKRPHRRTAVAFREPPTRGRDRDTGATTDCQDSSDATTADDRPKDSMNGPGRRRCFTRLKSASTSRLNYSPKRGEGWSSPLESLRQQLRKLDDLEDQFPDLACQPAYSLRYPFAELGPVTRADTPELEFVRHRALVEREGMRRARAVLKRRRAALRESRASLSPHRAPSEERETTELEVALHRARALLGEKEIRLRHIERALRKLAEHPPPLIQEATTSDASSESEAQVEAEATGAVLRSLRALHADVRDIWRALDVRARTVSPETSSNAATTSQTRMTLSALKEIFGVEIIQDVQEAGKCTINQNRTHNKDL